MESAFFGGVFDFVAQTGSGVASSDSGFSKLGLSTVWWSRMYDTPLGTHII